ncbi:MAG: DUF2752 domain-containing protein [Phycisphaerae bacterium]
MDSLGQQQIKGKLFRKASHDERIITAYILFISAGICLFIILAAYDIISIGKIVGPCRFKVSHNLPCPTCGVTTSMLAFFRGQILQSFFIQPTGGLLSLGIILTIFLSFTISVFGLYFKLLDKLFVRLKLLYIILILFAVFVFGWAVTLVKTVLAEN